MPCIQIYERENGKDQDQYIITVEVSDLDKANCVTIDMVDRNGDSYLLQIPTKDFPEFVRNCQRMKARLS